MGTVWTSRDPTAWRDRNWRNVRISDDGRNLITGQLSGRLFTSADGGYSWTERQPAGDVNKNWLAMDVSGDGTVLIAAAATGRIYTSANGGSSWTERQPKGDADGSWYAVASDADGSNLIALEYGGRVYTSSNSGANWTERQPDGDLNYDWYCCAMDADGSHMLVGIDGGAVYVSTNGGTSWTECTDLGSGYWCSLAMSADGSVMIASRSTVAVWVSTDSGANWTGQNPDTGVNYYGVACAPDGNRLVALSAYVYVTEDTGDNWTKRTSLNPGVPLYRTDIGSSQQIAVHTGNTRIWTSIDFGVAWTERGVHGLGSAFWSCAASDEDGSNLIAAIESGRLYTSANGGESWTERRPAGDVDKNWRAVASDADGSNLIASVYGGRLYTSANSGASWTERQPAGASDQNWSAVASDDDGSNLVACIYGGRLYTSDNSGSSWTERQPAGDISRSWYSAASDADGSHLIVGIQTGRLYTSANSGASWTERQPAGDADKSWLRVASDADGSHLIVCDYGGRLYTSANGGESWTERRPAGDADKDWQSVSSDSDGSFLMAGINTGRLYSSEDSGVTWSEEQPAGDSNMSWLAAAGDSGGTHLFCNAYGALVYLGLRSVFVHVPVSQRQFRMRRPRKPRVVMPSFTANMRLRTTVPIARPPKTAPSRRPTRTILPSWVATWLSQLCPTIPQAHRPVARPRYRPHRACLPSFAGNWTAGFEAIRIYGTGAVAEGDPQIVESANLGGYRSGTRWPSLSLFGGVPGLTIHAISGAHMPGLASLEFAGGMLRYAEPGGSSGLYTPVPDNGQVIVIPGSDPMQCIAVSRATDVPEAGYTLRLLDIYNGGYGMDNVSDSERSSGDTEHRGFIMRNESMQTRYLRLYLELHATERLLAAAGYAASGAVQIDAAAATHFKGWPWSGFVRNIRTGEVLYYDVRDSDTLSVPAAGRDIWSEVGGGAAGLDADVLRPVSGLRIATETPSAGAIQTIADEDTAPTSVTWYHPAGGTDASVIEVTLDPGQSLGLWLQRRIPAGISGVAMLRNLVAVDFYREVGIEATMYRHVLRGQYRVAETAAERYELYRGVDAAPDLEAAPWETFAALPHETAALAADHTYNLVLRARNRHGLASLNNLATALVIDDGGAQVNPPSAPFAVQASAAAGGTIQVRARYAYLDDAESIRATTWAVWLTTDGADPDPDDPADYTEAMVRMTGIASLDYTPAGQSHGTVVKALVRCRRAGTPDVDSLNTTIVSATADAQGPDVPAAATYLGQAARQT